MVNLTLKIWERNKLYFTLMALFGGASYVLSVDYQTLTFWVAVTALYISCQNNAEIERARAEVRANWDQIKLRLEDMAEEFGEGVNIVLMKVNKILEDYETEEGSEK